VRCTAAVSDVFVVLLEMLLRFCWIIAVALFGKDRRWGNETNERLLCVLFLQCIVATF
jgi:hypothetical protein